MQKALKKYFVNMDEYLASLGLYRKMMARDASCLFRAVSEQLYFSQNYHQKVRKDCVNFMRANKCDFEPFVEGSFEKYLERLDDPQETVGHVEIKALSLLYRRHFIIYRYPGKSPTDIGEDSNLSNIFLCCSNNGHYDIVYPRTYPVNAAICQSLLYELLYTCVLGIEEEDLSIALDGFRGCAGGGRRYRNSLSGCSEDAGYDLESSPREEWVPSCQKHSEEKVKVGTDDQKTVDGPGKLALPYKVLKALEPELYRNVEFDVWHESRKELQKTDYMVFAGRQYFLGDKCQVRLDPKGKYYNAFIQEVGTHPTAVTVFIEELGEKHLVSLTNLKPVNPVPAWNIATTSRKSNTYSHAEQYSGELDPELCVRRRFLKKSRGKEMLMTMSYGRPQTGLPPRLQPCSGNLAPVRNPGVHNSAPTQTSVAYENYRLHAPRPPRGYGASRSSARFLNRQHFIGPEVAYYATPNKRCYQSFDNYSFKSRRSRRQMQSVNKECQFSFVPESGEDAQDMEGSITFYEMEEAENAFSPVAGQAVASTMGPGAATYWVPRGPSPIPPGKQPITSSEEDPDERNTTGGHGEYSEEFIFSAADSGFQHPTVYTAESSANLTIQEGGSRAGSPQEGVATYSYSQQVVVKSAVISSSQPVNSAPAAIFTSNSSPSSSSVSSQSSPNHLQASNITPGQPPSLNTMGRPVISTLFPPVCPWFVNEMGEQVTVAPPPPYSYDPNGSDLPRDCKVLQYFFNLGVQAYQQTYWHSMHIQQVYPQPYGEPQIQPYPGVSVSPDHTVPQPYSESTRLCPPPQGETPSNGTTVTVESPTVVAPGTAFFPVVQEQCQPSLHPSYEPYMPVLSTTYHYLTPWTPGPIPNPRFHHTPYCPSSHTHVNYITTSTPTAHFVNPAQFVPPGV